MGEEMDTISKDALTETKQVLVGLAGFLEAIRISQAGNTHPAVAEIARKLSNFVTEMDDLAEEVGREYAQTE